MPGWYEHFFNTDKRLLEVLRWWYRDAMQLDASGSGRTPHALG